MEKKTNHSVSEKLGLAILIIVVLVTLIAPYVESTKGSKKHMAAQNEVVAEAEPDAVTLHSPS